MKGWYMFILVFTGIINPALGQEEKQTTSRISKGTGFLSLKMRASPKNKIDDSFYKTVCLGIGGGYYFMNRVALEAGLTGQHFNALTLVSPTRQEFNDKYLLSGYGRIRYNCWEFPDFTGIFLQSGYDIGTFPGNYNLQVRRWEIIYMGAQTLFTSEKKNNNIGMELGVGLEQNNLNKKILFSTFVGFNYYFRKTKD